MKYKHIKLISLLIDFLSTYYRRDQDLTKFLIDHGIRYPERELRELTLEIQERMASAE